jgi:hypothetical protein
MLRILVFELSSVWLPGTTKGAESGLPTFVNTFFSVPVQHGIAVSGNKSLPTPVHDGSDNIFDTNGYRMFSWAFATLTSLVLHWHMMFTILCVREELCDCVSRLELVSSCTSPERSIIHGVPFLNLQIFENDVAWISIRRYIDVVYHREVQRIVQGILTFLGVIACLAFAIITWEFFFVVGPAATNLRDAFDGRRLRLLMDVAIYAIMLWSFTNVQCEILDEKERHIQILAQERWRIEIKARSAGCNVEKASRFDRVSSTISQSIETLRLTDKSPSFLGIDVGKGLNGVVVGVMWSATVAVISYAYSLSTS